MLSRDALRTVNAEVAVDRCPSICLSVSHTRVLLKKSTNFFSARQPHHSSFLSHPNNPMLSISKENALCGALNKGWLGKFGILGQYLAIS